MAEIHILCAKKEIKEEKGLFKSKKRKRNIGF